jgi:hypothetical protein
MIWFSSEPNSIHLIFFFVIFKITLEDNEQNNCRWGISSLPVLCLFVDCISIYRWSERKVQYLLWASLRIYCFISVSKNASPWLSTSQWRFYGIDVKTAGQPLRPGLFILAPELSYQGHTYELRYCTNVEHLSRGTLSPAIQLAALRVVKAVPMRNWCRLIILIPSPANVLVSTSYPAPGGGEVSMWLNHDGHLSEWQTFSEIQWTIKGNDYIVCLTHLRTWQPRFVRAIEFTRSLLADDLLSFHGHWMDWVSVARPLQAVVQI